MRPTLALCLALPLVALGCGSTPTGLEADVPGSTWTVERVVTGNGEVLRGEGQVTFGSSGSLSVSSCNVCNGTYAVSGDQLEVAEPLACTRRRCGPGELELEDFFAGLLTLRRDGLYLVVEPDPLAGGPQVLLLPAPGASPGGAASGAR
ncbi:META domain-containing protein [Rubrivirga sp. S365]|uniref:META domain-containing protein n=1 Tax=Rubrivirga litoralis TaxID=3075598 RepID=A0ABU3BQP8_9BACT|nr:MULTISPECIES: META domain-containing protein [unclassified Rubrivirga]MDT0631600.1 META domain-containing protein [Rubrivirga sp. F394]MDT7857245.1 META domain-containing protein [Rubrivirga sp. S365]